METMSLTHILTHYESPYGDTWVDDLQRIIDDPIELEKVEILADAIQAGTLREAIFVADGYVDSEGEEWPPRVGNGMHRLAAAVLLGGVDLPVTKEQAESDLYLRVEFTCPSNDEAVVDRILDVMRSFPINDDHWTETDCMGGRGRPEGFLFDTLYNLTVTQEEFLVAFEARAKAWDLPITVVFTLTRTPAELDAEYNEYANN